ncbi:Tripartite ATP-independent transporter, DctQ component [Cognatiyoonia sediminum]|uniref:TRAP transporter small permease protein n=1 Tax=Cognatiyoonia sediminum TaxID=1508389 RepID=A0A1M5LFQ0_9RHOB|nr:TRAP transporter small permease subunit [Cognatiyoonia sediminum]SHG63776.1 Tripartite ATP-independent transporter, DctQ component [Cognatiyoonia sediminum]
MSVLFGALWPLERINNVLLGIGRVIAIIALAVMVCLILGQVFFRYVLNDAPNWTEEAARFGMLWMTGLMAPSAMRMGGFVAIDMLERALPTALSRLLTLFLLLISLGVLLIAWDKGLNNHVDSLSGRGSSASLRIPLEMFGGENIKFRNNWQFASLFVGVNLMILVAIELIIRQFIIIGGRGDELTLLNDENAVRAD